MIPKAELLRVAEEQGLLPTTVEKDYGLGWVLFGIAAHPELRRWIFKGGTCLKKCYFDTYRFSEDLDFTLPDAVSYEERSILAGLTDLAQWVENESGIAVPSDGIEIEAIVNKQGQTTFQARLTFQGPLGLPNRQRQRVKFDLTRHEIVVAPAVPRPVVHGYSDSPAPVPEAQCYSLDEIVAEKLRALTERSGRARDVYDVVNIARNFADEVSVGRVRDIAARKFAFKGLPAPGVDTIMARVDPAVLKTDWENSLNHQLQALPAVDEFLEALARALEWLLGAGQPAPVLAPVSERPGERLAPRPRFAGEVLGRGEPARAGQAIGPNRSRLERVRFAARNRLLVEIEYRGIGRLVEPYSLRVPRTGNLLLYVWEVRRGGGRSDGVKAFKVEELGNVTVTAQSFEPRYRVEL